MNERLKNNLGRLLKLLRRRPCSGNQTETQRKDFGENSFGLLGQCPVILESITDAFLIIDAEWRITYINLAAANYFNSSKEALLGKSYLQIDPEVRGTIFEEQYSRVMRLGESVRFEARAPVSSKWVEVHAYPSVDKGIAIFLWDISERRRLEEERKKESDLIAKRRLRTILDASPAFIWFKDCENKILLVNEPAAQSIGLTVAEIEGRFTEEFYPEEAEKYYANDMEVISSGSPKLGVIELYQTPSGGKRWVRTDKIPYHDEEGHIIGVIVFAVDITELKQTAEEVTKLAEKEKLARLEAERIGRLKDDFLITLSHELRTPLVPILGWSGMLISGTLNQEVAQKALKTIERSAKAELQLIEDLLDTSMIISGKLRLEVSSVDLVQVVNAAIDVVRLSAEAKHIGIQLTTDRPSVTVAGDAGRLRQVVWNLLTNSVKFTPKGGHIYVRVARQKSFATIEVSDTGIGIKPEFQPYLFDRFRQADSSSTREFGGLGLGLALVRHITEAHGGGVVAASRGEGKGTIFTISLPIAAICLERSTPYDYEDRPMIARNADLMPNKQSMKLAGLRVLVVDDLEDDRILVTYLLRQHDAQVKAASSVQEALEMLMTWRPHVLVSDIGMPREDGYSLMRKIRALDAKQGGQVPAIALTAYAGPEDERRVLDAGFQMHISKPTESDILVDAIVSLFAGKLSK